MAKIRERARWITSKHRAVFRGTACEPGVAPTTIGPRHTPRHSWGWDTYALVGASCGGRVALWQALQAPPQVDLLTQK